MPLRNEILKGKPLRRLERGQRHLRADHPAPNDMPIIDPAGLDSLGVINFQLNAHYTNAVPEGWMGETRDQRLAEFLHINPTMPVFGLPRATGCASRVRRWATRSRCTGRFRASGFAPGRSRRRWPAGHGSPERLSSAADVARDFAVAMYLRHASRLCRKWEKQRCTRRRSPVQFSTRTRHETRLPYRFRRRHRAARRRCRPITGTGPLQHQHWPRHHLLQRSTTNPDGSIPDARLLQARLRRRATPDCCLRSACLRDSESPQPATAPALMLKPAPAGKILPPLLRLSEDGALDSNRRLVAPAGPVGRLAVDASNDWALTGPLRLSLTAHGETRWSPSSRSLNLGAALAEAGLRWQLGTGSIGVSPSLLLLSVANRPFRAADSMRFDWSEVDVDGGMRALRVESGRYRHAAEYLDLDADVRSISGNRRWKFPPPLSKHRNRRRRAQRAQLPRSAGSPIAVLTPASNWAGSSSVLTGPPTRSGRSHAFVRRDRMGWACGAIASSPRTSPPDGR